MYLKEKSAQGYISNMCKHFPCSSIFVKRFDFLMQKFAPWLFLGTYNKALPYILMGSLTIASSVVNLFLPETLNRDLPETMEQMQECQGYVHFTQVIVFFKSA